MSDFECGPISYVTKSGLKVLDRIHLRLSSPEIVVINGPSGCGKSTLLRSIVGLNRARVAQRRLNGRDYHEKRLALWRSKVTLLLQDAPCIDGTILENLEFPFRFKNGAEKSFSRDQVLKLMRKVQLGHIPLEDPISRLSGGERHRLGIVRGLLWAPSVLLADEPLSGLEPELADMCFGLLRDYARERDAIVICVFHEERLAKNADEWLRLEDGTLHRVNPC